MDTAGRPNTHLAGDAALVERARAGDREAFTALSTLVCRRPTGRHSRSSAPKPTPARRPRRSSSGPGGTCPTCPSLTASGHGSPGSSRTRAGRPQADPVARSSARSRPGRTARAPQQQPAAPSAARSWNASPPTEQRSSHASRRPRHAPSRRADVSGSRSASPSSSCWSCCSSPSIGQRLRAPETPFRSGLVAFVRDGDVYLANPDGSEPSLVVHQDGLVFSSVAWSPDGRRVAIDGDSGAVVYDTTTGKTTYVGGSSPAWSPDSRRLAVVDFVDVGTRLRIQDVDSGTATTHPVDAIGDLAWSPDGRWIAASGSGDRYSNGSSVLVRLDVETGHVLSIDPSTPVRGQIRQPAWSPDYSGSHSAVERVPRLNATRNESGDQAGCRIWPRTGVDGSIDRTCPVSTSSLTSTLEPSR